MRRFPFSRVLALLFAAGLIHLPATAGACAACMGDVNSKTAPAMNAAIFLLLGFIGFMLASFAAFAIYLVKRAQAPLPPHAEFESAANSPEVH